MYKSAVYCTGDRVGSFGGGGALTKNEAAALQSVAGEVAVFDGDKLTPEPYRGLDVPFLQDYFASALLDKMDVGLAHFYSGTFTNTIRMLRRRSLIVTFTVPAHDRNVTMEECARNGIDYPYPHIKDDALWREFKAGMIDADIVFVPSRHSAEFLFKEGVERVMIIPHGCDLPASVEPSLDDFMVGYVGRIGLDKGLRYLISAVGDAGLRAVLAGPGTESLDGFIRSFTDGGEFILLGPVENPSEVYNRCSVYVQPSVTESFGIPVLEAMAHGRPVVVSNGCGASDLVTHGVDGFIVPRRDTKGIADCLLELKSDSGLRGRMGAAAREKAKSYTWEKIRREYWLAWTAIR